MGKQKARSKARSNTKLISKKLIQPIIQAVNVSNTNYNLYEKNFKELISLFNTVQVTAQPFMTRGGAKYRNNIHKPTYKWRVRTASRELTFTHPKKQLLRPGKISRGRNLQSLLGNRPIQGKNSKYEIELKHVININTANVKLNETIFITCEITDGVGQKATFTRETTKNVGLTPWRVIEFNLQSILKTLYMKHPELVKFPIDIRTPTPGPDPAPFRRFTREEQELFNVWNTLREKYIEYGGKELDSSELSTTILRINEKLIKDLTKMHG